MSTEPFYFPALLFYQRLFFGFLGLFFSFMLWQTERGPHAHGLEAVKPKA